MEINEKGICRLSVVPVRSEPSDKAEMVTQLLFGDHYTVIDKSKDGKWLKIQVYFDSYTGWVDIKQHTNISNEYFQQINNSDYKICTDLTSSILFNKHHHQILMGSILPIATNELFKMEEQLAFNGEAKSLSQKRDYDYLKVVAKRYLNVPYLWGGKSPFGIDCSGFTQMVFKICGYQLLRDASLQVTQGELIDDITAANPGDLAFFNNDEGKVTHVGIILENNEIIHASGRVRIDGLDSKGIYDLNSNLYSHFLFSIRRVLR